MRFHYEICPSSGSEEWGWGGGGGEGWRRHAERSTAAPERSPVPPSVWEGVFTLTAAC